MKQGPLKGIAPVAAFNFQIDSLPVHRHVFVKTAGLVAKA
jgi:hypothetical protein